MFWKSSMKSKFPISIHLALTLAGLGIALYMIFLYAPEEMTMGEVQRIFYVHVPAAWTALLGFLIIFCSSLAYLWKRSQFADELSQATAEVGFIFCTCVLVTGPLWAKPAWGIWWTWDARLTLTFLLWLLYVAYLMLRNYLINPGRAANLCAVVGVIGFGGPGSGLDPRMAITLLVSWIAFLFLFFLLLRIRLGLAQMRREIGNIRHLLAFRASED
jgi:heme exporter protein C